MIHPIQWLDIIIGVLIAEGFLIGLRSVLHAISNKNRNLQIAQRVSEMRPAALDQYRISQQKDTHAPLG
jgi:hypothetical protein